MATHNEVSKVAQTDKWSLPPLAEFDSSLATKITEPFKINVIEGVLIALVISNLVILTKDSTISNPNELITAWNLINIIAGTATTFGNINYRARRNQKT